MNTRMTMDELAGLIPLPEWISVADAAKILGGGSARERELIRLVIDANIVSCSHSSPQLPQAERTVSATGHRELLPDLRPDTDPTTVLIDSEDVVWRWCVDLESLFLNSGDKKLPPRDKVEARLAALKARSTELPTGGKPLPPDGIAPAVAQEPTVSGIDREDLPEELDVALIAFRAVSNGYGNPAATFKNRLIEYLEQTYPTLIDSEIKRIATVANLDKSRGRKGKGKK